MAVLERTSAARRTVFAVLGLAITISANAGDLFLMGDRVGYGITRSHGAACFAIAPSSIAQEGKNLLAMLPDKFRLPAVVVRSFDEGFAVIRIGSDKTACSGKTWSEGSHLDTALQRTGIGTLEIRTGAGDIGSMYVRVTDIEPDGFFTISPVRESDKLMQGMDGTQVLLEDSAAGILLDVDEDRNRGRVIRQDHLSLLVAPFFDSLENSLLASSMATQSASMAADAGAAETSVVDLMASDARGDGPSDALQTDSVMVDSGSSTQPKTDAESSDSIGPVFNAIDQVETSSGPQIVHRFFIGKQSWRNNPTIIGNRLFIGSSGRVWNEPDQLDGVYSFDLDTGEKMWFVHTDSDFNDLAYIKGFVVGGTDSGNVLAVGARSGKRYWTRKLDGSVYARPVRLPAGVAVATARGELQVLNLADGTTKASSSVDAGVRAGMTADKGDLWVATEIGTLYRYVGFGDVQMRRESSVYYPDEFGSELSGVAIDWYERLGQGRGQRAKFYSAPLIVDNRVILSMVRHRQYEYPPVMAFTKDGGLDWIGTDPERLVDGAFGDSRVTPASWYRRLITADPFSNAIYSMSTDSGEVVWATDLGQATFQHWASPVIGNDYVYVARHDGFLHKLQAIDGKRVWSIYLGQHKHAGKVFLANELLPQMNSDSEWDPRHAHPIFSTPAVSDNTIVVGTDEGYLYVINDSPDY